MLGAGHGGEKEQQWETKGESTAAGVAGGGATTANEVLMSAGDTEVTAALMWADV